MAGNVWNPNDPDVLGIEWRPVITGSLSVSSTRAVAARLRSRSAETIEKLRWAMAGESPRLQSMMIADIFEAGDEKGVAPGGVARSIEYSPSADTFVGNYTRVDDGADTNLYEKLDDNPVTHRSMEGTDFGIKTQALVPDQYRCRVDSGAFPLTARVLRLDVRYLCASGGFDWRDTDFRLYWSGAGGPTIYNIPGSHVVTHMYGKLVELNLGEINPRTLAPWTPQDVRDFSIVGGWELRFEGVGNARSPAVLWSLSLRAVYTDVENRVAAAIWRRPAVDMSIARAIESDRIVTLPGGTADWAKADAMDYAFVHRIANDPLVQYTAPRATDVRIDYLRDPGPSLRQPRFPAEQNYADVPVPGMTNGYAQLDRYGRVQAMNGFTDIEVGYSPTAVPTLMMVKAGDVVSEDSQPYSSSHLSTFQNKVHTGLDEYQELVPTVTDSYLGVDFLAAPPSKSTASLTVQIKTVGGTNVGGSFTISAAAARALPDLYARTRRINGWMTAGAALTAGTPYRVTFSSSAPTTDPWLIGTVGVPDLAYALNGLLQPNGDVATFQGAAGHGTFGGFADQSIDLMVTLLLQPDAPTDPTAAVVDVPNVVAADACGDLFCATDVFEVVDFTWAGSYPTLKWFEIEREEADVPGEWVRLARITDDAQLSYRDWGARRGVGVRYRVRAYLTNLSWTEWAMSDMVTPMAKGSEVVYASDARPDLSVAYDREPLVGYEFLSSAEDTFVTTAGNKYQKVFQNPNERGRRFSYDVTVNIISEPDADRKGPDAFEPLRALERAQDIPYVIVLDHEGHRYYAHIQVPEGESEQPEHVYTTSVMITEIAGTNVVIEQP